MAKAFSRLLLKKQSAYPFRIVGIHTARHGTAYATKGVGVDPDFGPAAPSIDDFFERARPDVAIEVTSLEPHTGEPAISHIRTAFDHHIHVITANKGPVAHAYALLCAEARIAQTEFRFESIVMDGAPVFNMVRNNLPGVTIQGFTGVLNSTSNIVVAALQRGLSMADGIREAQALGITEADASYDIDGWDSAAKAAALANVLMDARTTPQNVDRRGIGELTTDEAIRLERDGKIVMLVSRGERTNGGVRLQVRPEVISAADVLSSARGTSNVILFHTDLMGTVGTISINPGVEQTAYGLFCDLVDVARSL